MHKLKRILQRTVHNMRCITNLHRPYSKWRGAKLYKSATSHTNLSFVKHFLL